MMGNEERNLPPVSRNLHPVVRTAEACQQHCAA